MHDPSMQSQQVEESACRVHGVEQAIADLNNLAWRLRIGQKERAYQLCSQAAALARAGDPACASTRQGLAASLATMAIINADCGKPDQAITQCAEALAMLKDLPAAPAQCDVWIAMSWIHVYLGSYPAALEYAFKALNLSRELKDRHREAWALDAVASSYGSSGDAENSVTLHNEAVALFHEIEDVEGQARTLNNLACTLLESGQLDSALEASRRSLELARQTGMKAETVIFAGTVGDILIKKGDYRQAEEYIRSELAESGEAGNQLVNIYQQSVLGRLFLAQARLDDAKTSLESALALALSNDMSANQADCHQLLSEVAERQNDLAAALYHYKQFHRLRESITGEETSRRLAILKVTHQSESAMRDAEVYRLHNIELQYEIEERKRIESLLHSMAMLDPLTNLYNRRQFYTLAKQEIERSRIYGHPVSVLMLDLDHFKGVNDVHGHLTGDRVLVMVAGVIQSSLRAHDIVCRYGGEEFAVLLPETLAQQAYEIGERIRSGVSQLHLETSHGPLSLTMSVGVTNLENGRDNLENELDLLLNRADQALYCAKHSGRNSTHLFESGIFQPG